MVSQSSTDEALAVSVRGRALAPVRHTPLLLYGVLVFMVGIAMYLLGVLLGIPRYALGLHDLRGVQQWLVWYSGIPLLSGITLGLVDLLVLLDGKRVTRRVRFDQRESSRVTVALTAWNDEESIAQAVEDFLAHPAVERVIVVSNNSADETFDRAARARAIAVNESRPGYGWCVTRCLAEAARYEDTPYVVLCEGDRTFRASDIDKLLAYAPHADIVNGTRTSDPLREYQTQLTTFMYYGNIFVGKLLEAKHLGRGTMSDVGTTYKLCDRLIVQELLPLLNPAINLEFNAHLLDVALGHGATVVECPITFHRRVGASKGGNSSNWRGFVVGVRMIRGITFGWRSRS
ncbi:MAG: glycosyltransferase [Gemmatimonadaceae bacterium]|nr:glycosyltransferase [Gemmatimonadaceae bacterium]